MASTISRAWSCSPPPTCLDRLIRASRSAGLAAVSHRVADARRSGADGRSCRSISSACRWARTWKIEALVQCHEGFVGADLGISSAVRRRYSRSSRRPLQVAGVNDSRDKKGAVADRTVETTGQADNHQTAFQSCAGRLPCQRGVRHELRYFLCDRPGRRAPASRGRRSCGHPISWSRITRGRHARGRVGAAPPSISAPCPARTRFTTCSHINASSSP